MIFFLIFRYQFLSEVSKTVFLTSVCFQPPVLFTDGKQAYGVNMFNPWTVRAGLWFEHYGLQP